MSLLCCFRSPKTICQRIDPVAVNLPTKPPPVKLGMSSRPRNNVEETPEHPVAIAPTPSRLDSPMRQAMIDPSALNIEDSDDEDSILRDVRSSSVSTLDLIKTKFIRRRSPVSDTKSRSQTSVIGNSDEELARRAELKRIMHKRIQEELRSEEKKAKPSGSGIEGRNRENSSLRDFFRGGPRDTIEFSVDEMNEIKANGLKCASPEFIPFALPVDESQMMALRRRASILESTRPSGDTIRTEYYAIVTNRDSASHLQSSPDVAPAQLPSVHDSCSTHSWRLSCSADHITSLLGIHEGSTQPLSESHEAIDKVYDASKNDYTSNNGGENSRTSVKPIGTPETVNGHGVLGSVEQTYQESDLGSLDTVNEQRTSSEVEHEQDSTTSCHRESPLDLWLRSQEFQSSCGPSNQRSKTTALAEIPENYSRELETTTDKDRDEPAIISGELHGNTELEDRLPDIRPQSRKSQENTEKTHESTDSRSSHATETEDDDALGLDRAPTTAQEPASSQYTSSRYTTTQNSIQPSRKSSRLSLKELFGGAKGTALVPSLDTQSGFLKCLMLSSLTSYLQDLQPRIVEPQRISLPSAPIRQH